MIRPELVNRGRVKGNPQQRVRADMGRPLAGERPVMLRAARRKGRGHTPPARTRARPPANASATALVCDTANLSPRARRWISGLETTLFKN